MDVQSALRSAARLFLKEGSEVRVQVDPHRVTAEHGHDVRVGCHYSTKRLSGLAWDRSLLRAFLRALLEVGEEILRVKWQLDSRSGLAGGVLVGPTWLRARGELVERDAFFYHYRNRIPFRKVGVRRIDNVMLDVYQLESADPEIAVAFVIAQSWSEASSFLHFATAASVDLDSASLRASKEYLSLKRYLAVNSERLSARAGNSAECLKDRSLFHFKACTDPRNLEIFRILLCGESRMASGRCSRPLVWMMTRYRSPIRGFKFLRAESTDLQKIEFGIPEGNEDPPLFHPFW